ncbi:MAG: riboflavin biosynthesis protein RibF [Caldilineaceae bacterium]
MRHKDKGRFAQPLQSGLVTFDPHPLSVLRPKQPHWLLTTPEERLALAAEQGLDFGVIHTFTAETAALSADAFIRLLKQYLGLAALVVGPDFALGRGRLGDIPFLRALGAELDFTVHVIEPVVWEGLSVRSSSIRQALGEGDVTAAATMLGRPYHATGEVVHGEQRGRQIGIPTANLQTPTDKLLPANGVYVTRAHLTVDGRCYHLDSVTNLGVRPTVDGLHRRLEVHLFDFPPDADATSTNETLRNGDIYGQQLTVEFIARLRGEQRFESVDALVGQIHRDMAQARAMLATL